MAVADCAYLHDEYSRLCSRPLLEFNAKNVSVTPRYATKNVRE
jgi:hypothetical protein